MLDFFWYYLVFEVGQPRALDFIQLFELLADVSILERRQIGP